jgi:PST family polysaccharide transporter
MSESSDALTKRTARAMAWRFASKISLFGLRFLVLTLLVRLVAVDAFGLLNQALIVTGLCAVVSEIGMGPALVQRRGLTNVHIRVAFTVSVLCGTALMAGVWFAAPLAATAYRTPEVVPVLRLISCTCLLNSLGTTALALLKRGLSFRKLFVAEFLAYVIGYGGIGVTLALAGYGVWALAWAVVGEGLLQSVLYYVAHPHLIWPCLARRETRELFHFGTGMTLAEVANYTALTGDNFVVGRQLGPTALGLYDRAYQLMTLPISEFSLVVGSVLFPAYAEIQNQPDRLRRAFLASTALSSLVVLPVLVAMTITAPEMIIGVFGPQWAGAVLPLQILCLGGAFRAMYNLGDSVARARGAVYSLFWRHAVYAAAVIVASIAGSTWGIIGVAAGVVGALALMYLLTAHLSLRLIGASWRAFMAAQLPGVVVATTVAAFTLPLITLLRAADLPPLAILAGALLCSVITAITAGLVLPRRWHDPTVLTFFQSSQRRCAVAVSSLWVRYRQGTNNGGYSRPCRAGAEKVEPILSRNPG